MLFYIFIAGASFAAGAGFMTVVFFHAWRDYWTKITAWRDTARSDYFRDIDQPLEPWGGTNRPLVTDEQIRAELETMQPSKNISLHERERIRIHEAGHAVVALHFDRSHVLYMIGSPHTTAAGKAYVGNVSLQPLPVQVSPNLFLERIAINYGGYVAEGIFEQYASDIAYYHDISNAVAMAHLCLTIFAEEKLESSGFNYWHEFGFLDPSQTKLEMLDEVRRLCQQARIEAERIIRLERPTLEAIIERLEHQPLLSRHDLQEIWGQHHPSS